MADLQIIEVAFDEPIPPETFVFEPPSGEPIEDVTQQHGLRDEPIEDVARRVVHRLHCHGTRRALANARDVSPASTWSAERASPPGLSPQRRDRFVRDQRAARQETLRDDPAAAGTMLDGVGQDLKLALEELRELARGLHPAILTERGLTPALQSIATRAPFKVEINGVPHERLPAVIEAAIYYVVAETLTNSAKHAGASEAHVQLSTTGDTATVEIGDNGHGGANLSDGSGIRGLADRVEALGGRFELQSSVGGGTVVKAELPLR